MDHFSFLRAGRIGVLMASAICSTALADQLSVPSSQYPTIQSAIDAAESGDEIIIAPGTYRELLDGQNKSLTLTGAGRDQTILSGDLDADGEPDGTILLYDNNRADLLPFITLRDLTLSDAVGGVAFIRAADVTIQDCNVQRCQNAGVRAFTSSNRYPYLFRTIDIVGSTFDQNRTGLVAALFNSSIGTIEISDSSFTRNTSGVISADCEVFQMSDSIVSDNTGGGVSVSNSGGVIQNTIFERNIGKSLSIRNGTTSVEGCLFRDNGDLGYTSSALVIDSVYGSVVVRNCVFEKNSGGHGPAINAIGTWVIQDCRFLKNIGTGTGPIQADAGSYDVGVIRGCRFIENGGEDSQGQYITPIAGGVCVEGGAVLIEDCLFRGNKAREAGAVYVNLSQAGCWINRCRFEANHVKSEYGAKGGAVKSNRYCNISNSTFIGNEAIGGEGGAIYSHTERTQIAGCVFVDNIAKSGSVVYQARTFSHSPIPLSASIVVARDDGSSKFTIDQIENAPVMPGNYITTDVRSVGFERYPRTGGDAFWGDDPSTPLIDEGANDDFGDLHLTANSPAIDAGSNADIPVDLYDLNRNGVPNEPILIALDMDGLARFMDDAGMPDAYDAGAFDGAVDAGPYEYRRTSCWVDVNSDGVLDEKDYAAWIHAANAGLLRADQNRDGQISPTDFTAWISNFNAGCQ